jgi:hypothetical protein|nr:MAG TPA: hypothetical protein [Caudoviricetes sp.]
MDKIVEYSLKEIGLIYAIIILIATSIITQIFNIFTNYKIAKAQFRFTKVYEQQGKVITELYEKIIRFSHAISVFTQRGHLVNGDSWKNEEEKRLNDLNEILADLSGFYYPNRIYLPAHLCKRIEDFIEEYIGKAQDFENCKAEIRDFQNNIHVKRYLEKSRNLTKDVNEKLPIIMNEIEMTFRKMIGV